jgi:hypothetical protein
MWPVVHGVRCAGITARWTTQKTQYAGPKTKAWHALSVGRCSRTVHDGPAARRGVAGDAMKSATIEALRRAGLIQASFRVYEFLKTVDLRTLRGNLRYMGKAASDSLPIPPLRLVVLVAGTADIQTFIGADRKQRPA